MTSFVNISTYRFAPLTDLKPLRLRLQALCKQWETKGTILLSTEGINLFVAGREKEMGLLLGELRQIPGLETLEPKISRSSHQPFRRMLVRIKKEIIAFGVPGIDPAKRTSPKLPPKELKNWLDEGKQFILLDTRNDYEIRLGTFKNALPIGVKHFRDFPRAVEALPAHLREAPVVMFCTGGIRCEKAGPYMESRGFKNIFQLDGGILKYFEECGSEHYEGECFVFDNRVGIDPSLQETASEQCFNCLTPLTEEEQKDSRYVRGVSCHFCYKTSEERMRLSIESRHRILEKKTNPLPGSVPYTQRRPFKIPAKHEGSSLITFLRDVMRHVSEDFWNQELLAKRIRNSDDVPVTHETVVRAGERYFCVSPDLSEPPVNPEVRVVYEDEAIVVVQKPAPLPVHACGRFNRNTLQNFLEIMYAPQRPHIAHRLDSNTTGLVIIARTKHFAGLLQPQFATGEIAKTYFARVHGHPPQDSFVCELALSDEPGQVGTRQAFEGGLSARTEFSVITRYSDGTALLEARPITGRTNQIRIHLWELGWPICGDQLYLPGRVLGKIQTGDLGDAPLCLHAACIEFNHPLTGKRMSFSSEVPAYFLE